MQSPTRRRHATPILCHGKVVTVQASCPPPPFTAAPGKLPSQPHRASCPLAAAPGKLPSRSRAGQAALSQPRRASCPLAAAPGKLPSRSRAGQAALSQPRRASCPPPPPPPSCHAVGPITMATWAASLPLSSNLAGCHSAGISRSPVHYPALVTWLVAANRPCKVRL